MQNLKILNKKDIKKILKGLEEQFNVKIDLNYVFLKNRENKIFLTNKDIIKIDLSKLKIDKVGLYFGKIEKDGIRLSIEGSQLIGNKAKKNIIKINKEHLRKWLKGENINIKSNLSGFVLLKHNNDFLGCGKYSNGIIYNYIPKSRRLRI